MPVVPSVLWVTYSLQGLWAPRGFRCRLRWLVWLSTLNFKMTFNSKLPTHGFHILWYTFCEMHFFVATIWCASHSRIIRGNLCQKETVPKSVHSCLSAFSARNQCPRQTNGTAPNIHWVGRITINHPSYYTLTWAITWCDAFFCRCECFFLHYFNYFFYICWAVITTHSCRILK